MRNLEPLSPLQREVFAWQLGSPDFGERGQQHLAAATVLVTRVGGLGGQVAYQLAAAGVGRLVLAHAGSIRLNDLNRQLLMTRAGVGNARVASAAQRLQELNPELDVVAIPENANLDNVMRLTEQVDLIVDCAPLFTERFALNTASLARRIPLIECAMYDLEATIYTVQPGVTPCVRCLYPEPPAHWRRQFPVFGAVSGMVGCIGAMEAIKLLAGFGDTLAGTMLRIDLRHLQFWKMQLQRAADCQACAQVAPSESALPASPTDAPTGPR